MSWRTVVISNSAKLDYQLGFLIVRREDVVKIHLSEISVLLIETTSVSLTAALLCELTKKKIKVIFCDEKRNPSSELISYYGAHDTSIKIKKQIEWLPDTKAAVWTEIVTDKIRKQAEHLTHWNRSEAEMLYQYMNEIEFADTTNREGHAAKVYFNALFGMDFTRTAENSTNAALNYGYGIILSAFNREIVANGYITQLGLFHDNMFNQFNLGSDLMEPFRPLVDRKVKMLKPQKFEHDEKMQILTLLEDEVEIAGRKEYVNNAIKIYCRSVFDALNDNDTSLIKFYRNEL
jgi:CRISPR-associated endonuclease Cas1 subtype II